MHPYERDSRNKLLHEFHGLGMVTHVRIRDKRNLPTSREVLDDSSDTFWISGYASGIEDQVQWCAQDCASRSHQSPAISVAVASANGWRTLNPSISLDQGIVQVNRQRNVIAEAAGHPS